MSTAVETIRLRLGLGEGGPPVATEVRAGIATFLTMAYILVVHPPILAAAGMPAEDVLFATAVSAAIGSVLMGLLAGYPFALAPGMGLNAYFAFGIVLGLGIPWQTALAAVFVEGLLFVALTLVGLRTALVDAIPHSLKLAITAGIGLFLGLIGLRNAGLVVDDPATLVALGDLGAPMTGLALVGIVAVGALLALRVRGALLIAILGTAGGAWLFGLATPPESWFALPQLPTTTWLALDFGGLSDRNLWTAVVALLLVDLLDTAGTLIGVGQLGGFLDERGRLPRAQPAFLADALATSVGALLGTSTVTTYIESGAGVREGGRTGLTAVVVGVLFLLALFFVPVLLAVPTAATAAALLAVAAMMLRAAGDIDWPRAEEGIPALLTVALMPFTYSIANGIAAGVLSWVAIRVLTGRIREVPWPLGLLAVLLIVHFAV